MVEVLGVVELYFVVCFLIYIVTLTAVRNSDKEEKKLRVQEREKKSKQQKLRKRKSSIQRSTINLGLAKYNKSCLIG